jgi:hypothetical protein
VLLRLGQLLQRGALVLQLLDSVEQPRDEVVDNLATVDDPACEDLKNCEN